MRIRILVSTVSLFTSFVVGGCAPVSPTVAPTPTAPATSTPQPVFITATPWIVTATPTSSTPEPSPTPAPVPGKFTSGSWEGAPGYTSGTLGFLYTQGNDNYKMVVTDEVISGSDLWRYINLGNWQPNSFSDIATVSGISPNSVLMSVRGGLPSFLNTEGNKDHQIDTQLVSLKKQFDNMSNVVFTLGKDKDGKVWIVSALDNTNGANPKKYPVYNDGSLGASEKITPDPNKQPIYGPVLFKAFTGEKNDVRDAIGYRDTSKWFDWRHDGVDMFVDNEDTMVVVINGKGVLHPDWYNGSAGNELYWWAGYPAYAPLDDGKSLGLPSAVQTDILRPNDLPGSYISSHFWNPNTNSRDTAVGISFDKSGNPWLDINDGTTTGRPNNSIPLDRTILKQNDYNTFRLEYRADNGKIDILPFFNGKLAYLGSTPPSTLPDGRLPIDMHAGYQYNQTGSPVLPPRIQGQVVKNKGFIVESNTK